MRDEINDSLIHSFRRLRKDLDGDLIFDTLHRILYATDASVYREVPLGVAYPRNKKDLQHLTNFATAEGISLIPRAAGTSLAGQCVGQGLIVDVSRYMNRILELNTKERWVKVEPGVIRDELNQFLEPFGLFFGPITSTANRAMIGGMVGNNSCGTTSIKYGSTRDHLLEVEAVTADGGICRFGPLETADYEEKLQGNTFENQLYRQIHESLSDPSVREEVTSRFPKASVHRRNTGYAIDELMNSNPFPEGKGPFNFSKILAGSEGTLALFTEIKLALDPLPPSSELMVCGHFRSLKECLEATIIAMKHQPYGCELMDKAILDCTKENRAQRKNRFFLKGDPAAILIIELRSDDPGELEKQADLLISDLQKANLGYAFPKVFPPATRQVWELRAAGFGVLSNIRGSAKPVEFVEDTAVALEDLPNYIMEFETLIRSFGQEAVYYAHAGAGELHIRPKVNLKTRKGVEQFREIGKASASLVRKYRGSLSGEHGDGRVRAEFIPMVLGEKNYQLFRSVKASWDPKGIFNPGKICDAPVMNESLRYEQDQEGVAFQTILDFSEEGGMLNLAEKCNGSGDCRKLAQVSGGTMCPSYMATREEKDTTRARANVLREILTRPPGKSDPFSSDEVLEVLDLCLACKGCSSECPSNVHMALLKAEYLYQYGKKKGFSLRSRFFSRYGSVMRFAAIWPELTNRLLGLNWFSKAFKRTLGIHDKRSLPAVSHFNLLKWYSGNQGGLQPESPIGRVVLFADEFTLANEAELGRTVIRLLCRLGYEVIVPDCSESGRSAISKGDLSHAKKVAEKNVRMLRELVSPGCPMVGIEPSALLTFRDEYPRLLDGNLRTDGLLLARESMLLDEFLAEEIRQGRIRSELFTEEPKHILLHTHCHQKALSTPEDTAWILSLPENYHVDVIPSGCCGMAGSFGYEKEHYELSLKIGELILLPSVRKAKEPTLICATGTSCRHQIRDGTGKRAFHPAEILYGALK